MKKKKRVFNYVLNNDIYGIENLTDFNCEEYITNEGRSLLWYAALKGNNEIITELVKKNCNITEVDKYNESPFFTACTYGKIDSVRLIYGLLKDKNKINDKNTGEYTPLDSAVYNNELDIIALLIDEYKANKNDWLMHTAAAYSNIQTIDLLYEKGAIS